MFQDNEHLIDTGIQDSEHLIDVGIKDKENLYHLDTSGDFDKQELDCDYNQSLDGQLLGATSIPGLEIIPDFISSIEQAQLLKVIDSKPWNGNGKEPNAELRRRTQQYGYLFLFKSRTISHRLPVPVEFDHILNKLRVFNRFDHLVVNEYLVGQGIMPHVDAKLFGECICVLSMLSDCVITFTSLDNGMDYRFLLPSKSLMVMRRDSRYLYKHGIGKDLVEQVNGLTLHRERRVSITFRTICECVQGY